MRFDLTYVKKWFFINLKVMKKFLITSLLAVLAATTTIVRAQNYQEAYLGLPGDNLNLYAVMNLFQESQTLEEFERKLNEENSRINNLDLNGDNFVDYITVNDYVDGNVHNIVLRVALNRFENQDVAVFTVERLRNGAVQIQLIGDEALYGKNYIIEPIYAETPNPGYRGNSYKKNNVTVVTTTYYEVAYWPVIRFIYQPSYIVWRSSWYWGYYPVYWSSWRPYYWHFYYGYHSHWHPHYYTYYRHCDYYRYHRYNDYYYSHVRAHSPYVSKGVKEGHYKHTYSRPDQRSGGEALYARTHASAGSERRTTATVNSRSGDTRVTGQGSAEVRRTAPAASKGSTGRPAEQSASTARREPAASTAQRSTGKPESRPAQAQSSHRPDTRSAQANASTRSAGRPAQSQAATRSEPKPAPAHKAEPARMSKPSAPVASSQGQRRSSEVRSTSATQKSSSAPQKSTGNGQRSSNDKAKENASGKPSRR